MEHLTVSSSPMRTLVHTRLEAPRREAKQLRPLEEAVMIEEGEKKHLKAQLSRKELPHYPT